VAMVTKEAQRAQIFKRLRQTGRNETVCLWGWETAIILDYINDLERGRDNGASERKKADSQGTDAGNRV
jgi:hypothetical protein